MFERLSVLYLHANAIPKVKEVEKLTTLTSLRSLTLHGNPMETVKGVLFNNFFLFCEDILFATGYRISVISTLPTIRSLDFSTITAIDRDRAKLFKSALEKKKAKKRDDY